MPGVQVFDLSKDKPDKVLRKLYDNLEDGVRKGDKHAQHVKDNLRVLACGGDGTVAWVVTSIKCASSFRHAERAVLCASRRAVRAGRSTCIPPRPQR